MNPQEIEQLVAWLKEVSPSVLAAAQERVTVNLYLSAFWAAFFVVVVIGCYIFIKKITVHDEDGRLVHDSDGVVLGVIVAVVVGIFSGFVALLCLDGVIRTLLAPNYAVLEVLTNLLKSK